MNEIERAIGRIEGLNEIFECEGNFEDSEAIGTALTALRAELARQDAKLLTCDGCKWEFNLSLGSADMCYNCNRMRKKDRYEPKGEKE